MPKPIYPTFDICHLEATSQEDMINADRFNVYLEQNPHLKTVHKHKFYHLVYFSEGEGKHTIDFENFEITKGMIYFMKPEQVHNWNFTSSVDGYIVNFSPIFFEKILGTFDLLNRFPIFNHSLHQQVIILNKSTPKEAVYLFEHIIKENEIKDNYSLLKMAELLLSLFILTCRQLPQGKISFHKDDYSFNIVKDFEKLLETNFKNIKLRREYAALLFVTPNRLNGICNEYLGRVTVLQTHQSGKNQD